MKVPGQRLLLKEWQQFYPQVDISKAEKVLSLQAVEQGWRCQRCGNLSNEKVPAGFFYCPTCLGLGRIDSRSWLYFFPTKQLASRNVRLTWSGELSSAQQKIADQLLQDQEKGRSFLLWAVTGAGKTEILFPLIKATLQQGKKIAITSPRVDVCNEVYLRFSQAFPEEPISLYHGQERKTGAEALVICTVHQLLRYYQYFDLVIVDEVDAFPYADDPLLHQAVERAQTAEGHQVYLSATPPEKLKKEVDHCYYLPARYHRRVLPVPQLLFAWRLEKELIKGRLANKVLARIVKLLEHNHILVFCPNIAMLEKLAGCLQGAFPAIRLTTVYSQDVERLIKVEKMREGDYQLVLTTTILERGVTFERVSVIVLQASHRIFNRAALVQMAGRADRKGVYHQAEVIFVSSEVSWAMKRAIREINQNNRQALKEGLIDAM